MECGFYLLSGSDTEFSGVNKKIDNQIKVLSKKCKTIRVEIPKKRGNLIESVAWRLPLGSWGADYDKALSIIEECSNGASVSFFYIRTQFFDRCYISFLRTLRQNYTAAKIILEIPTYPYDFEIIKSKTMWPWYFKDHFYRGKVSKYIDRIATFTNDYEIFNVPTIRIMNGMDVDSFSLAKCENDNDTIKMIAVAMMQPYHGFERLIKGLHTYYNNGGSRDVHISFVGYGPELAYYKKIVEECKLSERVLFAGKLSGEALDNAYDGCDIAIGSMGGYKIGIEVFSSIKLGEYLAKGLPVVTGARTLVFDKYGDDYNLDFPNDSSEIEISKIVDFYDKIYKGKDKRKVREEIRAFAMQTIDVSITMKDVLDYLEN